MENKDLEVRDAIVDAIDQDDDRAMIGLYDYYTADDIESALNYF